MNTVSVYERLGLASTHEAVHVLELDHAQRDKGRLKAMATDNTEVRVFLERGKPLQVGEKLAADCGAIILVTAKKEPVLIARCDDWHLFSRACYHLGNRHVKMQIGDKWLAIQPDHVLQDMLLGLGLDCEHRVAEFVPEHGAYASGGHHHHHDH